MVPSEPSEDEPYRLDVRSAIDTWLSEENPSSDLKRTVGEFLKELTRHPLALGAVVAWPVLTLPLYSTVPGTDVQVAWEVVKSPPYALELRHVRVDRIKTARVD